MATPESSISLVRGRSNERRVTPGRMFLFARNFFRHPAMLGSVIPSSRFLVNDVLSQVDWQRTQVIIEFGPGVGTMTREILRRMRTDAILVALELNSEFVDFLQKEISDPRLRVVNTSAGEVRGVLAGMGFSKADCIVSGIPYTNMPADTREQILRESREVLNPAGSLLIYQFTSTVLPYLQSSFRSVSQRFQLLNILPARIFHCTL